MKFWIARDKEDNELWGYEHEPVLDLDYMMYKTDISIENTSSFNLPSKLFPEVTFENSPQEIEIKLVKK